MSIRNLKDGSKKPWLCECYPQGRGGKRIRKKFATKGEAAAFERFTMNEVDDKPWLGDKPDHRRLMDLLEDWWQLHGHTVKTGKNSYDAIRKTIQQLNNPVAATFRAEDYLNYRSKRLSYRGKDQIPISSTTHNNELIYLKGMFNRLIKYKNWKLPNPLADIELIKTTQRELGYLSKRDINTFFVNLSAIDRCITVSIPQLIVVAKICLATGARISEALNLKLQHVDKYKLTFINTKGKKNRSIPISEKLYDEIIAISISEHDVFNLSYKDAWRYISRALPNSVPAGQATHILRHTFASHFMMNKGDILVLQRILGHAKIQQTMVYAHFSPDHLIQAVELNPLEN